MLTGDAIGYDPERVRALGRRTSDSIRALDAIASSDPAAASAMRIVRLIRRNLSDLWMPLIREIENSSSMTAWSSHLAERHRFERHRVDGQAVDGQRSAWLTHVADVPGGHRAAEADAAFAELLVRLDDDELLGRLEEMAASQARAGLAVDPTDPTWTSMLVALGADLDRRLADDSGGAFARDLLDATRRTPMIALAAPYSALLSAMAHEVAVAMLAVDPWVPELHPVSYERGVDTVLALVVDTPGACLELLLDERALHSLAAWETLDADIVNEVVWNGLHTAVTEAPARLADGYDVLRSLTLLANGPLDGGFAPGVARGVADSLTVYVDTLAPAIRYEGDDPVTIHAFDPDLTVRLGTYDELVDLFGAVLRDEAAQASVGVTLGAYADRVVDELGDDLADHVGIEYVARITDLVGDAARTERAEIVLVAAEALARQERTGSLVTFGATAALGPSATFASHLVRTTARTAIEAAGDLRIDASADGATGLDPSISAAVHRHITVAVLQRVADDPTSRSRALLDGVTGEQWELLREHLDDIERAQGDIVERHERIDRMERYIERFIPALGGHLRTVRAAPGMHELEEDRAPVGADDDR